MKKSNTGRLVLLTLFLLFLLCGRASAQDALPPLPQPLQATLPLPDMPPITHANDTIPVEVFFPLAFRDTGDNRIVDPDGVLQPVLERLRRVRAHFSSDTVRIVHIGDSHVRGHIYPRQVGTRLVQTFGEVNYTDMGVNGATCLTFTHPERIRQIAELKPELLILSFGTNESYNRRYDAAAHYRQMDELVTLLREALPGVPILLTTPPGSYDRGRRRRGVRTYTINPRVPTAAIAIRRYAADHQLAVWDLFDVAGGSRRACANWTNARLMRPDHVHFFAEGYVLQGDLLYEALIKAYNDYVSTLQ